MSKVKSVFVCQTCGAESAKWLGRCLDCGEWGSVAEEATEARGAVAPAGGLTAVDRPVPIGDVEMSGVATMATGIMELDRVLAGGLTPGSVTLLGGEPGIGKSTLVLQAMCRMAATGVRCLLVSAEESKQQVRSRAERIGALPRELWIVSETSLPNILEHMGDVGPAVVAVDSIQTVFDPEIPGAPGSVSQVRDCAYQIVQQARAGCIAVILVGHVTKEGTLAGPRVLEHVVDTVLSFEGDRHHALRMLRALKHRFGSTHELGLFEMRGDGLDDVPDPSALFLTDRKEGATGSMVTAILEGARPLLIEVQALVAPTNAPMPRRSAQGIDSGRLALLLGVLERRARLKFGGADVYASVAGGARITETGADLAVALALASALADVPLPPDTIAIGELGLGGEIRQASQAARRLAEAGRLGFARAVVPASTPVVTGISRVPVSDLREALAAVGLG